MDDIIQNIEAAEQLSRKKNTVGSLPHKTPKLISDEVKNLVTNS